jgi:hypothetical protein
VIEKGEPVAIPFDLGVLSGDSILVGRKGQGAGRMTPDADLILDIVLDLTLEWSLEMNQLDFDLWPLRHVRDSVCGVIDPLI